jgi:hypothetical protein
MILGTHTRRAIITWWTPRIGGQGTLTLADENWHPLPNVSKRFAEISGSTFRYCFVDEESSLQFSVEQPELPDITRISYIYVRFSTDNDVQYWGIVLHE